MDLNGKTALVTGASRGLGEGAARALAKQGAKVMLVARDGARVQKVAGEIGGEALACDVSDYAAVAQAVAATRKQFGGLDILVNNAGLALRQRFTETTPADWKRQIDTNLYGAIHCCHEAAPHLEAFVQELPRSPWRRPPLAWV